MADYGVLERWGKVVLRPHMRIVHRGVRKVETVAVKYRVEESSMEFSGSTAYGISSSNLTVGDSRYIRAWVINDWGFPAHHCQVFVERIWLGDRLIDDERSPLHWTDLSDHAFSFPYMRHGDRNGRYVDICSADSVDSRFQVISQKWTKGYHRFAESGVYKLELCAEAMRPCSFSGLTLLVRHDQGCWKNLHVVSADEARGWWL